MTAAASTISPGSIIIQRCKRAEAGIAVWRVKDACRRRCDDGMPVAAAAAAVRIAAVRYADQSDCSNDVSEREVQWVKYVTQHPCQTQHRRGPVIAACVWVATAATAQ